MNATQPRTSARGGRSSLFYRDLSASPATRPSSFKGEPATAGKSPAALLWRDNISGSDHPPPPLFSLDEKYDRSPEVAFGESPAKSFESRLEDAKSTPSKSPLLNFGTRTSGLTNTPEPERAPSSVFASPSFQSLSQYRNPGGSPSWWSPVKDSQSPDGMFGRDSSKEGGSPVSGVVQQPQQSSALLTLPPVREIVRPEATFQFSGNAKESDADADEWITAFGFGPDDTNIVMRELEKCGPIVRHIPGPGGANWIHVQFQNKQDALKALYKNGMQINGALILGIKPLDPSQRQALVEKSNRTVFNVMPPKAAAPTGMTTPAKATARPYYLQPSTGSHAPGPIASPSKSLVSKLVDLVFGL